MLADTKKKIIDKDQNIIEVDDEDREFILELINLSDKKKILAKGIIIGLNLSESKEAENRTARWAGERMC